MKDIASIHHTNKNKFQERNVKVFIDLKHCILAIYHLFTFLILTYFLVCKGLFNVGVISN